MRSPLMIFGGKRYLADEIVSLMPPHEVLSKVKWNY
jgi:site-specific DNA-adenine methylase